MTARRAPGTAAKVTTESVRLGARVWVALGIVYVVWGSTYLAIRFAIETLPPLISGGFRFLTAGLLMLALVVLLRGRSAMLAVAAVRGEFARLAPAEVTARSWLALGYLVVFGSLVAFTAYVWLLGRAPVSVVSTYAYVNPAVAVLLGALLAGERLTGATLAGGLVILAAVAMVVTTEGRRRRVARRAAAADAPPDETMAA